jgi:cyclic beta-1,2-glucan synthetase
VLAAVAGAVIAEWLKFGLVGQHQDPLQVFQNMAATGLLAASASSLSILQAPAAWSELLMLSGTAAAGAVLLYHLSNVGMLAGAGKHVSPIAAILIVGAPFVVGGLTLLSSSELLRSIGRAAIAGGLTSQPALLESIGGVVVLFCFNALVTNALVFATKGTLLRSVWAHLVLLAIAIGVTIAPSIASYGSSDSIASLPAVPRALATVLATTLSQAGLWAEAYLVTGLVLDAISRKEPSRASVVSHPLEGIRKGIVFSGTFMGLLYTLGLLWQTPELREMVADYPLAAVTLVWTLFFPLAKTIIESFDGSTGFFRRIAMSYSSPVLYLRGAIIGLGLGYAIVLSLSESELSTRLWFGFGLGVVAYAGIDLVRDLIYGMKERTGPQPARVYLVHGLLGGSIGAALGFYFDSAQVAVVVVKFNRYLAAGVPPETHTVYPLLSKWGFINLGVVTGGVSLLFREALAGVISFSVPSWLFAINRAFMAAHFQKEAGPITALATREGLVGLTQNMIQVLRWGLWMSPIINSFLRPMGEPAWYNQDGAIRTIIAIVQDLRLTPEEFGAWSLQVFIWLLAYDAVRILIWLDHFGLRVATLVNLSFLGVDKLERRLARFLSPAATARCIPEGVKRFTTWMPLLIPFYIPRGKDWDHAWSQAESIARSRPTGFLTMILGMPLLGKLLLFAIAVATATAILQLVRNLGLRHGSRAARQWSLVNTNYEVGLKQNGEITSGEPLRGYDLSRRSYDLLDPSGRTVFLVDTAVEAGEPARSWPLIGNFPKEHVDSFTLAPNEHALTVVTANRGIRATIEITLPEANEPIELWSIAIENLSGASRRLRLVPYLEWLLNRPDADRGHTQYYRLFAEMEYLEGLHTILAWDKHSQAMGFIAADEKPSGFLTARVDFLGRAQSLWSPRVLETLTFTAAKDTPSHPTLDPIGSLDLDISLAANQTSRVRLLMGMVKSRKDAIDIIAGQLSIATAADVPPKRNRASFHPIKHGEMLAGNLRPYFNWSSDGRALAIHTPFTPRPFDHTMSNRLGHIVSVTNRGLHMSASVNSQQNRLTPDWPDIVTREVPGEAFYLYDVDTGTWCSPTYHPLGDASTHYQVEFGVDGSATFRSNRDRVWIELVVFVPPDDPTGVYLLTLRNESESVRRFRVAPYFQIVLADQPEHSGPLKIRRDEHSGAVYFENPRNTFRSGPAFVAMSPPPDQIETNRGYFFGARQNIAHPYFVERAEPDLTCTHDDRPIAALLSSIDVPAGGETTIVVILGQADDHTKAEAVVRKYQSPDVARATLESTRQWWHELINRVQVETNDSAFDNYLHWMKYQALAERIWSRRGFYQASGAFGFRDQLQDSVNLIWMDSSIARQQIMLHASQQFPEGDVVHWFHRLEDGRTGFVARTHASDNPLWLAWAVTEYVTATGDETILDEETFYLEAEQPFPPLPANKHGMGFDPLRPFRADSVYRHAMAAIDLVLDRRMGSHGLPLMGAGDWNDGLDEIGSQGRGESVWLGFFLYYILDRMAPIIEKKDGPGRLAHYTGKTRELNDAIEATWRGDRYLRAIHDDGTEIGIANSGVWEIDALTAAWAVMSGINPERGRIVFETALAILEKNTTILLGWPPLREDTKPYLGRSSWYPEGVRENGMYCHGVQWLVGAARILANYSDDMGQADDARRYRETADRLWRKISAISHAIPEEIETYGGQPNKQAADMVTTFDPGRMIWNGYTGAAGWMFRQALEGVLGLRLERNEIVLPDNWQTPTDGLRVTRVSRTSGPGFESSRPSKVSMG